MNRLQRHLSLVLLCCLWRSVAWSQDLERIVSPEEVEEATHVSFPIRVISAPHRFVANGMEKGLIKVERDYVLERMRSFRERFRALGFEAHFGGMGEQTGFGGGFSYTLRPASWQRVTFLGRATLAHYQEYDVRWGFTSDMAAFTLEASHQWRPKENFYGLGHNSLVSQHTSFGLSQSWGGANLEITPSGHFRWGAESKLIATKAVSGSNERIPSTEDVFPDLPGMSRRLRFISSGMYMDSDFSQSEYGWAAKIHAGASYQQGIAPSRLRYFTYEWRLEGRMPVTRDRSGFVGQLEVSLNHENDGSDPIPFYLRPRIGGSSTLRGFQLDRFYGKSLARVSVDYRYRIHPRFQTYIFHDAGQIFDRTGELTWTNWHRNYGLGLRLHSNYRTIFRLEFGYSREGADVHLIFGDRAPQSLGAVRYGTYRR